jgi:transposase
LYVKIDQWFPSSKTCHHCGYENNNLTLGDREWECPQCARKLDRDINASKNILREGLQYIIRNTRGKISAGTVDYTDGTDVRLTTGLSPKWKRLVMKSEALVGSSYIMYMLS